MPQGMRLHGSIDLALTVRRCGQRERIRRLENFQKMKALSDLVRLSRCVGAGEDAQDASIEARDNAFLDLNSCGGMSARIGAVRPAPSSTAPSRAMDRHSWNNGPGHACRSLWSPDQATSFSPLRWRSRKGRLSWPQYNSPSYRNVGSPKTPADFAISTLPFQTERIFSLCAILSSASASRQRPQQWPGGRPWRRCLLRGPRRLPARGLSV